MGLAERFWVKVDKNGPIPACRPELGPCWIWKASTNRGKSLEAYGQIRVEGKLVTAHRVAYELANGRIPNGLVPDHLCRVRLCVNDSHLELITQKVNCLRGISPCAVNARKTHCARGHRFTKRNTYLRKDRPGTRDCIRCIRLRDAGRWHHKEPRKKGILTRRHD